jgi:hypothetical protein
MLMNTFQVVLSTAAVLQVILLAMVSSTLIDIKARLVKADS